MECPKCKKKIENLPCKFCGHAEALFGKTHGGTGSGNPGDDDE